MRSGGMYPANFTSSLPLASKMMVAGQP